MNKYHGILLDTEFTDPNYLSQFRVFAKKKSNRNPWTAYGVIVSGDMLDETVREIQSLLIPNAPYYTHLYNEDEVIVIFKERFFKVTYDKKTWDEVLNFGNSLGIPKNQMDIKPCRFEDEEKYFGKENYLI